MNNRLKYLTPFLCMLCMASLSMAQESGHVYLKTGSVIRGKILEVDPADHVKIEDRCGNIWYYPIAEVEKISSEPHEELGEARGFGSGFVNMTSMGFLAGSSSNSQVAPFSLVTVNGRRSSYGLFAGVGIGIEFLSTNYMPLFLDLRYDLRKGDVVPYLLTKGGWSLPLSSGYEEYDTSYDYEGGALFGAGIGLKIRTREHFAWDVALMYRYQRTAYSEKYEWNQQIYEYTDIYSRVEIRLGFYLD